MSRRTAAFITSLTLLALACVGATLLPVPYVRLSPGPTYNTIGQADGTDVISITGTTTYPTSGSLDLTTVNEAGGPFGRLTLGDALRGWLDPAARVVPSEDLYPSTVNEDDVRQRNANSFDQSQSNAIAAAMKHLDTPVTTRIVVGAVTVGSPSDGRLQPDDVLLSINGTAVRGQAQVGAAIKARPAGTVFAIDVERSATRTPVTVTSAPSPKDPAVPYIGITTQESYSAPFPITFGVPGVGGPSAGLMFALGIVDRLTPGELNGGREVAGTGTITPTGTVGPIGGIAQKMAGARSAGAELFLAPRENCRDVAGHVPEGLVVVPVTTLDSAVTALEGWVAGRPQASCPG